MTELELESLISDLLLGTDNSAYAERNRRYNEGLSDMMEAVRDALSDRGLLK